MNVVTGQAGKESQTELSTQTQQTIAAAIDEARVECLALSTLMRQKLPRELRDLIYSLICSEERRIPVGPYFHFRKYEPHTRHNVTYSDTQYFPRTGDLQTELPDGQIRTDHDVYPPGDMLLPQNFIFSSSYMGEEAVLETLKIYYESNTFSVCNVEHGLHDLCAPVFNTEGSATDIVPIDHIQDLQIRVKYEHFPSAVTAHASSPIARLKDFAAQELILRDTVESLASFREKLRVTSHHLNIEVVLMSDLRTSRLEADRFVNSYIINFLQSVRDMVYELLHDHDHATVRVTYQDDNLMAFPKDITRLFKLTQEQWEFERSRQQPNRDLSQHFWIIPICSGELGESEETRLGGYCHDHLDNFIQKRWGASDILNKTTTSLPITDGFYWPIGRPYNSQVAQEVFSENPNA